MKKTVILCIGNALLFIFFGLAFLFPFSEVTLLEPGLSVRLTVFPFLLVAYLIVYPIVYHILAKKYRWGKKFDSELSYADEREKNIVAEATKVSYIVLITGLLLTIAAGGGLQLFALFTGKAFSGYFISVALLTAVLVAATISYCVTWCLAYNK